MAGATWMKEQCALSYEKQLEEMDARIKELKQDREKLIKCAEKCLEPEKKFNAIKPSELAVIFTRESLEEYFLETSKRAREALKEIGE